MAADPASIEPDCLGLGSEAIDLARLANLHLDPWQRYCMNYMLATRETTAWNPYTRRHENLWAAFEVGIMLSRQQGKGSLLEARELAGLFILGERLIIHSAHQFDTSKEAFDRIMYLIEDCPELDAEVQRVTRGHGEEGLTTRSGQRLRFRTRTKGGGRGFTADCLVLDEAMYLTMEQVGALMPTLSARPNPQLIYTGSAGDRNSTQFARVRNRALEGNDPRLFYAEWSVRLCTPFCSHDCQEHDAPGDIASWAKANPALGIRLSVEHVETEYRSMDPATFARERLGVGNWPVEGDGWAVIDQQSWNARHDPYSVLGNTFALAVDTTPDRAYSCLAAAGLNADDETHVEVTGSAQYDHRPGMQWVIPRVLEICAAQQPSCVVIDKAGQAGSFVAELESHDVKVVCPSAREYAQACGEFYSGVIPRKGEKATVTHMGQAPLTNAVASADKRLLADMWAWNKRASSADISPLVAATLAAWGFANHVAAADPWVFRG